MVWKKEKQEIKPQPKVPEEPEKIIQASPKKSPSENSGSDSDDEGCV